MKMVFVLLCWWWMPLLYCMEDKQILCDDVLYHMQKMLFCQSKSIPCDLEGKQLSSNFARFETENNNQNRHAEFQLEWNKVKQYYCFLWGGLIDERNEKIIILNKDQDVTLFDGPNDNNIFITDYGWYICDILNYNQTFDHSIKKKDSSLCECWCDCTTKKIIRPYVLEHPLVDHTKKVEALALHKTLNICVLVYHSEKYQNFLLYSCSNNYVSSLAHLRIPFVSPEQLCKKISFLTDKTLLFLTESGDLVTLAYDGSKGTLYKQTIADSNKKVRKIKNFAIDNNCPTQMIMAFEDNVLALGNLIEHTYTPLLANTDCDILKFYNDIVATRMRDSSQLILFDLFFIKRSMLSRLLMEQEKSKLK